MTPTPPDGYWILNAPGHRLAQLETIVVAIAETELHTGGALAHQVIDGDEEWVCDRCNGTVEVFHPAGAPCGPDPTRLPPAGRLRPVPVADGAVLCDECFLAVMGGDLNPAGTWGSCGCDPCQAARSPATR